MSLILEALRKSESERRLGRAPELLSAMPVTRVSAPRRHWLPWLATAAATMLVSAAIYRLGPWNTQRPQPAAALVNETATQSANAPGATAATATKDTPTGTRHAAQPSPSRKVAPEIATHAQAAPIASPAPISPQALPPVAPARPAEPLAPPGAVTTPDATTALPAAVAAKPPAVGVATAAEPALLSIAELSADERRGLPALSVSMHVYADDPAKRFMIVDGHRVGEGARLADGVVLVRIRRDGAEIDVRGRRLLLQKP